MEGETRQSQDKTIPMKPGKKNSSPRHSYIDVLPSSSLQPNFEKRPLAASESATSFSTARIFPFSSTNIAVL
jgi:hypothetical protein